jgi:hypothetical protein
VQVGEFKTRRAAEVQIAEVSHRFASLLHSAEASVDGGRRDYRAKFTGFTRVTARQTCATVQSHGLPCLAGGSV